MKMRKIYIYGGLIALILAAVPTLFYGFALFERQSLERGIAACAGDDALKIQCFQSLLLSTLTERGLSPALSLVARLYEQDVAFAEQCHGNMHEIGAAIYERYKAGDMPELTPETAYCGFGLFHGFLERLVLEEGDMEGAGDFCRMIGIDPTWRRGQSATSCFHGIGHGITDGTDPRLWGKPMDMIEHGLDVCARISKSEVEHRDCASGVFNAIAIFSRNPSFSFSIPPEDPYVFCRELKGEKPFIQACYDQMNTETLTTERSFKDAVDLVGRLVPDEYKRYAINGIAGIATKRALFGENTLDGLIQTCSTLEHALAERCVQAVVAGIFEFGTPEKEYLLASSLCASVGSFKEACADGFISAVSSFYGSALQRSACTSLGESIGAPQGARCSVLVAERVEYYRKTR